MLPRNKNRAFYSRIMFMMFWPILLFGIDAAAQKPSINSISHTRAEADVIMTVAGTDFGTVKANLVVFFGGAQGEIITITNTKLEVKVPPSATYDYISVTNLTTGLTGYAKVPFFLSFSGSGYNSWSAQTNLQDETGLIDLCMCDFNGNGKLDVATSSSGNNNISIWRNTSNLTTINFEKTTINILANSNNVTCGDIDGDGKPDLIYAKNGSPGDRIYVLKNISTSETIAFAEPINYFTTGLGTRRVKIKDLDNDGRPEIIVTNNAPLSEPKKQLFIIQNLSTPGTIVLNPTVIILETEGITTNGLDVEDLNGDGLPDIVCSPENAQNFYVFQNKSTPGNISFHEWKSFTVPGSMAMLKIGDIDNDGKPDIIVTKIITPVSETRNLSVFLNTTPANGAINFGAEQQFQANPKAYGLDLGDLDGDGKIDIAVASLESAHADVAKNNKLSLFRNTSTPGNVSFNILYLGTTGTSRMVKIADVNGDGKPDLNFTTPLSNNISFIRNLNCFTPRILPPSHTVLCDNGTITLEATKGRNVTYSWTRNNIAIAETSSTLTVTSSGSYKVQAVSESGTCSRISDATEITSASGNSPDPPQATNTGPACIGGTLQLNANTISGATYKWTGPNGFASSIQNPQLTNVTAQMAGTYYLEVSFGDCPSEKVSTQVEVNSVVPQSITAQGPTAFCAGKNVILSVPTIVGYQYQWKFNGANVNAATSSTLEASQSGSYTAVLTKDNCTFETQPVRVDVLSPPVAAFNAPAMICKDKNFNFTDASTLASGVTAYYKWDFGDGKTSTERSPIHAYAATGSYLVRLTVHYEDEDCKAEITKSVSVVDEIAAEIQTNIQGSICEGQPVTLSVSGTFSSFLWNTGATTPTLEVTESGTYSVTVATPEGCTGSGIQEIDFLINPVVDIVTDEIGTDISRGESVQLTAHGAYTYAWFPSEGLNDATIANPIAKPTATTTYTVVGTAANGCSTQKEITINVSNTINVNARKIFSPNGDNIDDFWVVDRIHNYPDCTVAIFDRQGLKVFEKTGYNNEWDGTYKGQNLMHGVYFYVIRCGTNENQKTGSITLLR